MAWTHKDKLAADEATRIRRRKAKGTATDRELRTLEKYEAKIAARREKRADKMRRARARAEAERRGDAPPPDPPPPPDETAAPPPPPDPDPAAAAAGGGAPAPDPAPADPAAPPPPPPSDAPRPPRMDLRDPKGRTADHPDFGKPDTDDSEEEEESEEEGDENPFAWVEDYEIGGADEYVDRLVAINRNAKAHGLMSLPEKLLQKWVRPAARYLERELVKKGIERATEEELDPELTAAGVVVLSAAACELQNYRANEMDREAAAKAKGEAETVAPPPPPPAPPPNPQAAPPTAAPPTAPPPTAPPTARPLSIMPFAGGRWKS